MFIRHHLHYYAICLFLLIISCIVHKVFFMFLFLFLLFFIYKTSFVEVLIFLLIVSSILYLHINTNKEFKNVIEGKVIDYDDDSVVVKDEDIIVKVYHSYDIKYGDTVKMKVSPLEIYENSNDYSFNEKMYFKANHIDFKANCEELLEHKRSSSLVDYIESKLSSNDKVRSYQRLFLLGIKDQFIEDDYNQLLELSFIHLFALSGMHLYYLKKLFHWFFSYFFSKKYIIVVTYIILFLYLINIPYSISLYRAYFMMILYDILKGNIHKLDIYWLVFIVFLLINPYYIYNYSFVFSFGIYFFVVVCENISYKDYYVYLMSLPLIILFQNRIHLFSFVFSLFLSIFVEYFYLLIVISVIFPVFNGIITIFISLLNNMVLFIQYFDIELVFARPPLSFFVLYYMFGYLLIMHKQMKLKSSFYHNMLIALIISSYFYGKYPLYASVTMIDVGQGDCTLIRLPLNQGNILIDTGGNNSYDIAQSVLIPYLYSVGISSLDYVYISHDDFDHSGALDSLIANFKVNQVIKEFEEERIIGDLSIKMLDTDKEYDDLNDQSLIMLLSLYDYKMLFMGDCSINVEKDLYSKYGNLDVDILKVSHHGSNTSTGNDLFKMIEPKIALIGVGKNNVYRHPSYEVINRLERKGIVVLRTDIDGMFHIRFYGKKGYIFR